MASIFNLKSWVSLDDAAKHLNPFFDEEIDVKDLLGLVLEGHLQLSINFVNHTYGVLGQAVSKDEIQESDWEEMELPFSGKQYVLMLHELYNDKWLREQNRKTLQSVTGVWDLTIAGHGLYEVEHLYYILSNGTGVTKDTLGGVEVTQGNKTFVIYEPFHADKKKAEGTISAHKSDFLLIKMFSPLPMTGPSQFLTEYLTEPESPHTISYVGLFFSYTHALQSPSAHFYHSIHFLLHLYQKKEDSRTLLSYD